MEKLFLFVLIDRDETDAPCNVIEGHGIDKESAWENALHKEFDENIRHAEYYKSFDEFKEYNLEFTYDNLDQTICIDETLIPQWV